MTTIHLKLTKAQALKLQNNKPFQLSYDQLKNGGSVEAQVEVSKKEHNRLMKNVANGKGHRFKEVIGGKINWKAIGNVAKTVAKKVGHVAIDEVANIAHSKGIQTFGLENVAHKAIEAKNTNDLKNVAKDVGNIASKEIVKKMMEQPAQTGGKVTAKSFFKGVGKVLTKVADNPIVQNVASDALTGVLMGASVKRKSKLSKGSQEAKDHMKKLREMRKKKGGALFNPSGP